ncbi:MAG: transglutaminase domain-containing protein [Mucilaginibacter sp.]
MFMLVLSCGAFAQPNNTRPLDTLDTKLYTYVKNTPDDVTQDIDKLVQYLKQPGGNQRDVVKSFAYWIMQNVSYDVAGFFNGTFNSDGISGTLRDKKGVCQDYAELFKAMCDRSGIPCYVVSGFAKAFNYKPGDKFNKSNHSWNIIYLDGNYTQLDLTWSSGYIQYVDDAWRYYIHPDITQCFSRPEEFVERHLPTDPKWQLLHYPVSMDAFLKYDDHSLMLKDSSRFFNYADSLGNFFKLSQEEQELKSAEDAYRFYPVISDYAYHYYNLAVNCSNAATDAYNAAVTGYNKSVAQTGAPAANGDYNKEGVQKAIDNYAKAVKLLSKIKGFADDQINSGYLLQKCNAGFDASTELMKTLK